MSVVSVRLDAEVQAVLEEVAAASGMGLSTYLRRMAESEARRIKCERIRAQSRAVAEYIATSEDAQAFYDDWGTPTAEGGSQ
jgi:predicted transcriptional regulator